MELQQLDGGGGGAADDDDGHDEEHQHQEEEEEEDDDNKMKIVHNSRITFTTTATSPTKSFSVVKSRLKSQSAPSSYHKSNNTTTVHNNKKGTQRSRKQSNRYNDSHLLGSIPKPKPSEKGFQDVGLKKKIHNLSNNDSFFSSSEMNISHDSSSNACSTPTSLDNSIRTWSSIGMPFVSTPKPPPPTPSTVRFASRATSPNNRRDPNWISKYEIIRHVAKGNFGSIMQVKNRQTHETLALKRTKPSGRSSEATVMSKLKGLPHLVQFHDAWSDEDFDYILMQFCEMGDLDTFQRSDGLLDEPAVWLIIHNVCTALNAMHSKGYVHVDVKPSNIVISEGKCFLTDFGSAKRIGEDGAEGDSRYLPKLDEISSRSHPACDVFSLGISLFELLTDHDLPPDGETYALLRQNPHEVLAKLSDFNSNNYSEELKQLIFNMMHHDPSKRPSLEEILAKREVQDASIRVLPSPSGIITENIFRNIPQHLMSFCPTPLPLSNTPTYINAVVFENQPFPSSPMDERTLLSTSNEMMDTSDIHRKTLNFDEEDDHDPPPSTPKVSQSRKMTCLG